MIKLYTVGKMVFDEKADAEKYVDELVTQYNKNVDASKANFEARPKHEQMLIVSELRVLTDNPYLDIKSFIDDHYRYKDKSSFPIVETSLAKLLNALNQTQINVVNHLQSFV